MPRVKIPRCARLLKIKLQDGGVSTQAPAKAIAARKYSVGQGAVVQNKAGAYTQLQEGRHQNKPITGTGLRGLLIERPGSFAAAPYLLRRDLHHGAAAAYVRPAQQMVPPPSFAARPVWKSVHAMAGPTPQERRQAAIDARLARLPLYTYAQLGSKRGVQKHSHAQKKMAALDSAQKQGLRWYDSLAHGRSGARHKPAVVAAKQREGLAWYGRLGNEIAVSRQ
ncbi:hypothetical protein CVIRNUC_009124 [Coccomyxa viridis]|uniref:Uncharacterized protein n=1 Tax=Coccomyxa viridis TaxID=1274662 RepID=A0AAV1IEX6_9CHLO|nr:hypothetical protein CVIRNUC_009124 [Coccomyxa viridis]